MKEHTGLGYVVVNPSLGSESRENIYANEDWLAASTIDLDQIPGMPTKDVTSHSDKKKSDMTWNKLTSELFSKVICPAFCIIAAVNVCNALTVSTFSNFEFNPAPDYGIAAAFAVGAIIAAIGSVVMHKDAQKWRSIEAWMDTKGLDTVDIYHPFAYRDIHW